MPKKKIVIDFDEINNFHLPIDEPFILVVLKENIKFDFVCNFKKNIDKLLVLGSGVTPRDKIPKLNPYYNRVSWDFKYSTIFYNDPSSYIHNEIYGAWGIGTKENWYLEILAEIIKKIANQLFDYKNLYYNNIIFVGSSQGGFMSFMLSVLVKNSMSICDIPQTDILKNYNPSKKVPFNIYKEKILKHIFYSNNIDEIYEEFGYRLNFIELMKRENYIPNSYLCLDCSYSIDFYTQYLPFFEQLNQLPFKDEFSNNIRIRIDGKNAEHSNMSKECLMKTIDNVFAISSSEGNVFYKNELLNYNILENAVRTNDIIRFYGINVEDINNLSIFFNDNFIPFNILKEGFSNLLGKYYDLPASYLGEGIHKISLYYKGYYSKFSKIFVKNNENVLDYNVWSGCEYEGDTSNILSGKGQKIEINNEWSFFGDKSLKITKVDENFVWTDIPTNKIFEGDHIKAEATVKSDTDASMFFVFTDFDGNQTFSNSAAIHYSDKSQSVSLESNVKENIKLVSLRFWIKGDIGSTIFVDDIAIYNKKINVAIYGSCGTKDPFTSLFNKNYKKKYLSLINDQRHSFISTMQEKEIVDDSLLEIFPEYGGSKFITKCLIEDFNKLFLDLMVLTQIDFLVFDVYFEVDLGIIRFNENKFITNARGFEDTEYYDLMENKKIINIFNNYDLFIYLWKEHCDKFFEFLETFCPNTKIVLSEIRSIDKVLRKDGSIYANKNFSEKVKEYNPYIIELENYIKDNFDVKVIPFKNNVLLNENHVWGMHHIHYTDDYYHNFLNEFDKIVNIYKKEGVN